ncbi:putative exocyst complex component 2 [Triplophysa rosa]|uniref:Exocyst complex component 2 n=1 Tax=Triplophysa rosa TaxID=992332 RepID=A0A9W7TIU5_TRIRA|nr:putative exocyst complex component 2 [Triplophysa rosa]
MSRARQPPLVTGISPNEGTPWTKVTIRGENLGTGPNDLTGLSICGHNCLLTSEWMSASKIVCRVGPAKDDKGEIVVTTRSGGRGTSTVSFKLLKPERIGILDQSAVWVDEINYYDMRTDRNKGISPLSLRPSNPLGIDIDKGKVPLKDLENMFPGMSGDFTSENFSATWYLMDNHSSTSFEQLRLAVGNLKKQASKKNEGSLAYVKGGLSTFFEAQDALASIHQKLESDGTEKVEGSMTQRLENILNRASETADTLFQEVLGRKDKADSTRNALNVLQRFKFLFNLPLNIERNIQKGDYDVVINDYEKAKSLFGNTEVPVFKKVYSEVETRIQALRILLLDKLLETPSTLHDQKRYIRYLSDLHAPGDPAWQCIIAQHKWILQLMQNCKEDFIKEQKVGGVGLELDRSSALNRINLSAPVKRGGSFQTPKDDSWHYKSPQQVRFVEKLSDVVISQLPNFWKLWISYVNGSLFSETGEKSGQVEKFKKNARQRQSDFKSMIEEVTRRLVQLVRGALLPSSLTEMELRLYGGWDTKTPLRGAWLTQVIHTVRLSHEALSALEIPNDLLQVIHDLLQDLRVHCLLTTLQHTEEDVKRLAEKEDWVVDNEGITSLPAQFEQCMIQMLQSLKEPMECKTGEINILNLEVVQDKAYEQCVSIMKNFIKCLEQLSTKTDGDIDTSHVSVDLASPDLFGKINEDFSSKPNVFPAKTFCAGCVCHSFHQTLEHYAPQSCECDRLSLQSNAFSSSSATDTTWRDTRSSTWMSSRFASLLKERTYLRNSLCRAVCPFGAAVFTVSKELVPRVLSKIIEAVAEEMSRLMQCVSSFSKNGALQARLEICGLRDAVEPYLTSESRICFKQAIEALPQLQSGADKKLLEELLNKFKSSMKLQLNCFKPASFQPVKR